MVTGTLFFLSNRIHQLGLSTLAKPTQSLPPAPKRSRAHRTPHRIKWFYQFCSSWAQICSAQFWRSAHTQFEQSENFKENIEVHNYIAYQVLSLWYLYYLYKAIAKWLNKKTTSELLNVFSLLINAVLNCNGNSKQSPNRQFCSNTEIITNTIISFILHIIFNLLVVRKLFSFSNAHIPVLISELCEMED